MSTRVKICGLTDADAVAAAVEAGADAVGFVFASSPRQVSVERAAELAADIPPQVLRVAVMLHPQQQQWREVRDGFRPDVLQTDAADYAFLDVPGSIRRWPVIREGANTDSVPGEFVYEGPQSGKGQQVDWQHAAALAKRGRMILAGGLSPANVADAISRVRPWGVDVSSAVESKPGKKDPQLIHEFVRAASASLTIEETSNES